MSTFAVVVLVVVVVALLVAGLLVTRNVQRTRARGAAGELRRDVAQTAAGEQAQADRVEQAEAVAAQARDRADRLEAQAREERTAYDMMQAQREDAVREADRMDPDVDHRSADYTPQEPPSGEVAADEPRPAGPEIRPSDPHDPDFAPDDGPEDPPRGR